MTQLTLVVLYCRNVESSHRFYRALGIPFTWEQHTEGGAIHWSATWRNVVLELYPTSPQREATRGLRLGFSVQSVTTVADHPEVARRLRGRPIYRPYGLVIMANDPDDNTVELIQPHPAND